MILVTIGFYLATIGAVIFGAIEQSEGRMVRDKDRIARGGEIGGVGFLVFGILGFPLSYYWGWVLTPEGIFPMDDPGWFSIGVLQYSIFIIIGSSYLIGSFRSGFRHWK